VPMGATSGAVSVTNPSGTAMSASSFTVTVPTSGPYTLTVSVSGGSWVQSSRGGVTVTQTNITPNFLETPSQQVPTVGNPVVWRSLPAGTFLVTCNYKVNGTGSPTSAAQTVTITTADQQITFNLTQ
jgi:hypothetical protein